MTADRCVVCGGILPEGGLVCVNCLESNGIEAQHADEDERVTCGLGDEL
ncbi:MAG: hypothetical protein AB9880_00055 [Christensenellales bacterium]